MKRLLILGASTLLLASLVPDEASAQRIRGGGLTWGGQSFGTAGAAFAQRRGVGRGVAVRRGVVGGPRVGAVRRGWGWGVPAAVGFGVGVAATAAAADQCWRWNGAQWVNVCSPGYGYGGWGGGWGGWSGNWGGW